MTDYYGDPTTYKAYWLARGTDKSAQVDGDVTAALLVASEYIDANYRSAWPGWKFGPRTTQVRDWPRSAAYDVNWNSISNSEIPVEVQNATFEMASRQLDKPGTLRTDIRLNEVIHEATVIGAVSVRYASTRETFDADDLQLIVPIIDAILAPILTGSGNVSAMSGRPARIV